MGDLHPLVAHLRELKGMHESAQELHALKLAIVGMNAAAPEVVNENLAAPLERVFERLYHEVFYAPFLNGAGGNHSDLVKEVTMLGATAAEIVLVKKYGLSGPKARTAVLNVCPSHVRRSALRDWSSSTRRLTDERKRLRDITVEYLSLTTDSDQQVLEYVKKIFERTAHLVGENS